MPGCLCALTLAYLISFQNVAIEYIYSEPRRCTHGKFHYDRTNDALVFERVAWPNTYQTVSIPFPTLGIEGEFSVWYCWGQATAIIGGREVGVIRTQEERGIS